jgi:hypothetical protein
VLSLVSRTVLAALYRGATGMRRSSTAQRCCMAASAPSTQINSSSMTLTGWRFKAYGSMLKAQCSRLKAQGSRLKAQSSRLT